MYKKGDKRVCDNYWRIVCSIVLLEGMKKDNKKMKALKLGYWQMQQKEITESGFGKNL